MTGSQASLPITSGIWLNDSELALLNWPEPTRVTSLVMPVGKAMVLPATVVWGFSIETAAQNSLFQFLVIRSCGWRAQTKPTTYCASMVVGTSSLRGVMPLVLAVASDQFWPASSDRPSESQSMVVYMLRIRRLYELLSLEFAVCAAPRKSISFQKVRCVSEFTSPVAITVRRLWRAVKRPSEMWP